MNKTLIITGGTINEQFLVEEVKQNYETIIAVDKGLETALKLNIHIHHLIGDFDSLGSLGTELEFWGRSQTHNWGRSCDEQLGTDFGK